MAAIADSFKYFLQIADFVYTELELITSWLAKTAVAWEVFGEGAAAAAGKWRTSDFSGVSAVWKDTFAQLDAIQEDYHCARQTELAKLPGFRRQGFQRAASRSRPSLARSKSMSA